MKDSGSIPLFSVFHRYVWHFSLSTQSGLGKAAYTENCLAATCAALFCRGTVETFSSQNSDVLLLKKLLFHDGFEALKNLTEKTYYAYRESKLLQGELVRGEGPSVDGGEEMSTISDKSGGRFMM